MMAPPRPVPGARRTGSGQARPGGLRDVMAGRRIVKIIAGEHMVSADPAVAIGTVLGSCVSACIRDPEVGVGGMNHFMLPSSDQGAWGCASSSLRYGNFAMERLINDVLTRGGRRERLEAKVFGGARLLSDSSGIGARNARFVQTYLEQERVRVLAEDMLGTQGRRLLYLPVAGLAFVCALAEVPRQIAEAERRYRITLPQALPAGSIELFD